MIKRLLLSVVLLVVGQFALAAPVGQWQVYGFGSAEPWFTSANNACASHTSSTSTWSANAINSWVGYNCKLVRVSDGYVQYNSLNAKCADGSAADLSQTDFSKVCADPPPAVCNAGPGPTVDITTGWLTGPDPGSATVSRPFPFKQFYNQSWCYQGCQIQANASSTTGGHMYVSQTASANGYYREFASAQQTSIVANSGTACLGKSNGDTTAAASEPAKAAVTAPLDKCPVGSVPSGQDSDGTTICIGVATQPASSSQTVTSTPKTTSTDASGNTVESSSTTQTNTDGSKTTTTTTTTTAPDGSKTVQVSSNTTAASNGAPGTTDPNANQPPPSDMCKLHPELTVCRNSQVTGACAQIVCDGDAIQCATLRAAATMQCQQAKDLADLAADPNSALGKAVASGNDPMAGQISDMVKGSTVDLSQSQLDQTGWLGGGQCLQPITLQVRGQTFTASFDSVCDSIKPIRAAIMLMSFIIAYMIVSRSVLQS